MHFWIALKATLMDKIKIYQYNTIDSTQTEAKRIIANTYNIREFIVLSAQQTNGIGRLNRHWESTIGNLYMSLVLQNNFSSGSIMLASSLGVTHGLGIQHLSSLKYKWPNDILINEKKVCGILLERFDDSRIIIGIGVNIKSHPGNTIFPATNLLSWNIDIGHDICETAQKIGTSIIQFLHELYHHNQRLIDMWIAKSYKLNQEIVINIKDERITGTFLGLDKDMSIIVETKDGIKKATHGDVM